MIPFTNPRIAGEFVFHCHIAEHEDHGMMANIRVLPKPTVAEDLWDGLRRLAGLGLAGGAADDAPAPDRLPGGICRAPVAGNE